MLQNVARDFELGGKSSTNISWAYEIHTTQNLQGDVWNTNKIYTGLSKKMDGIWNRYNLKSTGRIYTFGILKCSEKFKVLDLP